MYFYLLMNKDFIIIIIINSRLGAYSNKYGIPVYSVDANMRKRANASKMYEI